MCDHEWVYPQKIDKTIYNVCSLILKGGKKGLIINSIKAQSH